MSEDDPAIEARTADQMFKQQHMGEKGLALGMSEQGKREKMVQKSHSGDLRISKVAGISGERVPRSKFC